MSGAAEGRLLTPLSEDSFLRNLQERFHRDIIYTWVHSACGPLVALNPGRALPLYSAAAARRHAAGCSAEPHVYGVLAAAGRARARGRPQLLLATGVSGAGKTEAARQWLQAAVLASGGGAGAERLVRAATVLEAFGNAATGLNHNASRFGKLLDLEHDERGRLAGGHVTHYLLERSRCGRVPEGERNFHVFYQLLAGADGRTLRRLRLQRGRPYRLLPGAAAEDEAHFAFTSAAMLALGLDENVSLDVWRVLAFLVKLGELEFMPAQLVDGSLGVRVRNPGEAEEACAAVGADPAAVLAALGVGSAEWAGGADWAAGARDRMLGGLYERLFSWLVGRVNAAGAGGGAGAALGLLDMYGLEAGADNGLERLLVNCAAESVQAAAERAVLRARRERARADGLDCPPPAAAPPPAPAAPLLRLAESEREEAEAGGAAAEGARFAVRHFGGAVRYRVRAEPDGAARLAGAARAADCAVLRALFPSGSPRRPAPRAARQAALLGSLEARLAAADVRLVHCLRTDARAGRPDAELLRRQLRSQRIVEMSASMREDWDEWLSQREAAAHFGSLHPGGWRAAARADGARSLLLGLPLARGEVALGRQLVFLRHAHTLCVLEQWRAARVRRLVTAAQRGWRRRRAAARRERAARVLQRAWRRRAGGGARRAAAVVRRAVRLWARRRYVVSLARSLPTQHRSPLCEEWPECPRWLREPDELLRALHHRWRCHLYRQRYDQVGRNRMREKVTASLLFRGRKESYPASVAHPFVGDYVRLRASAAWAEAGQGYVVFADVVGQVGRSGRVAPVLLVLTTAALLLLEPRSLRARRRLAAARLAGLALSPARDDVLAVRVRPGGGGCVPGSARGDVLLRAAHALELAAKLYLVVLAAAGRAPRVLLAPRFAVTLRGEALTVSVHAPAPHAGPRPPRVLRRGEDLDVLL